MGDFDFVALLHGNYIDTLAVYRREVWEVNKGYDANMPFMGWEDWDFWINSHTNGFRFHYINQSLYYYRHLGGSMLRSIDLESKFIKVRQYIFTKYVQFKSDELLRIGLSKTQKGEKLSGFFEIVYSGFFPKFSPRLFLQRVKIGLSELRFI